MKHSQLLAKISCKNWSAAKKKGHKSSGDCSSSKFDKIRWLVLSHASSDCLFNKIVYRAFMKSSWCCVTPFHVFYDVFASFLSHMYIVVLVCIEVLIESPGEDLVPETQITPWSCIRRHVWPWYLVGQVRWANDIRKIYLTIQPLFLPFVPRTRSASTFWSSSSWCSHVTTPHVLIYERLKVLIASIKSFES